MPFSKSIMVTRTTELKKNFFSLCFETDPALETIATKTLGAALSKTKDAWHLPESKENLRLIFKAYKNIAWVNISALQGNRQTHSSRQKAAGKRPLLNSEHATALEKLTTYLKVQRFSPQTIASYTGCLRHFLEHFNQKKLEHIDRQDILAFNKMEIVDKGLSASTQRQYTSTLKLLFGKVLNTPLEVNDIEYARKGKHLPVVLSKEEVAQMIRSLTNDKHKVMLLCLYAQGLRRSELVNLRVEDIDFDRTTIHIKNAKGAKDRILPLSNTLAKLMSRYLNGRAKGLLIAGQKPNTPYSGTSIANEVKTAASKANVAKRVTPHTLRHSYVTHCLDLGVSLRHIQEYLGHHDPKTTMRYT